MEEALTLVAENGYDGTGVNQIRGKEDILNALIDSAETRYEEYFGSSRNIGKLPESKEGFIQTAMRRISFTVHDIM